MIFAVIADVHGNHPALEAVLSDAKAKGAQGYLLLGDYIRDTPLQNEIVESIRHLPNCTVILGNGDKGVLSLDDTKPKHCEFDQMYPNYWAYYNLSEQSICYLKSLKNSADVMLSNGKTIHMSHSIGLIDRIPRLTAFHSGDYGRKMESAPFSFDDGIQDMQNTAETYAHEVTGYVGDICLYGHNHLQFLGNVGNKTLCNPGSCGQPLDYDTRAPYAILSDEEHEVKIELHRVVYDLDKTIAAFQELVEIPQLKFWMKLWMVLAKTGSDIAMSRFWLHARELGGNKFPMENDIWRKAVATYQFDPAWGV